jgi:hypothetical protein
MASDLAKFQAWLRQVGQYDIWRWLCDAYWHDQLEGTELKRAYLLSQRGVNMRTVPIHPHVGSELNDTVSLGPSEDVTFAGTIPNIRPKKLPGHKLRPIK